MSSFFEHNLSRSSFLVTGGAGFIGSHVVEYLLNHGARFVRVLDNLSQGRRENVEPFINKDNFELIVDDISNLETCHQACQSIDYVCHQAALGSVPRSISFPDQTNTANVTGTLNLLIAASKSKVSRFVYASSSSVYGDCQDFPKTESRIGTPLSPYASSKRATELYANNFYKLHGLPTIGLRYFNVFGPRQRPDGPYAAVIPKFMDCLKKNVAPSIHGDGEQSRDFTYVANAVEANIRALCVPAEELFGETCNVACGKSFSVNDLFKHLCNIAGVQCSANYVGERQGDVRDSMADISKATEHLGYQGRFGFEDGLRATWQFFDGPASGTTREIESSG